MNLKKYKNLPNDMIFEILSFDDRFILRRGKLMNRIPKNDKRYNLLSKIPQKNYNSYNNTNYVTIYINEKKDYFIHYNGNSNIPIIYIDIIGYEDDNYNHISFLEEDAYYI